MFKIGMLMTRNEADVIAEVMGHYEKQFDTIFCMDNSTDNTLEIVKSFKNVEYAHSEKELYLDSAVMKDGIRAVLLAAIQGKYGYDGWIFCINGDEILHGNIDDLIDCANTESANSLNAIVANFVLHESERESIQGEDKTKPITERRLWYFLSQQENIGFKNQPGLYYIPGEHMRVGPHGFRPQITCSKYLIRRHYNMRSPEQLQVRIEDRVKRDWQRTYSVLKPNIWVNDIKQVVTAGTAYSGLQKFDGKFKFGERFENLTDYVIAL